ncbi:MAG: hypothetical protein ACRYFX_17075 [Janthinobacterium lividum]
MKRLLLVLLSLVVNQAAGQNITGLWQAGDTVIGSMYREHYIFSAGNKFIYNTSGYDGLQRVISIGGHYKLVGKTLYLTPEYTVENREGRMISRSHITTLNDSWEIEDGTAKTYNIAKPTRESVSLLLVKRKKGLCLLLNSRPFYFTKGSPD